MIGRIIGRAGTGKTTALKQKAEQMGYGAFYVTYNRAMADHARKVIHPVVKVGTVHSFAFQLIARNEGLKERDFMPVKEIKKWMEDLGIPVTGEVDEDEGWSGDSLGDRILQEFDRARHSFTPLRPVKGYHGNIEKLYEDYVVLKHGRYDYTDGLEQVVKNGYTFTSEIGRSEVRGLYGDEFQDFTPLMIKCFDIWADGAKEVWMAGDDMQLIYRMKGVGNDFMERPVDEQIILTKSYRQQKNYWVGKMLEQRVTHTIPVDLEHGEGGEVGFKSRMEMINYILGNPGETIYILFRTRWSMGHWNYDGEYQNGLDDALIENGIPFGTVNSRHNWSPWNDAVQDTINFLYRYSKEMDLQLTAVKRIVNGSPVRGPKPVKLLPHIKGKIDDILKEKAVMNEEEMKVMRYEDFISLYNTIPSIDDLIGFALYNSTQKKRAERAIRAYERGGMKPMREINVFIDTIHGAKGREADTVFLDTAITKKVWETIHGGDKFEYEDEQRVWYVGTTRNRKNLYFTNSEALDLNFEPWEMIKYANTH
ncbi:MAG: 3'-5' exonuclease [Thermoplasmatales archaeon]